MPGGTKSNQDKLQSGLLVRLNWSLPEHK